TGVPGRYEPFGMVVLEAMTHGLAIAATATGGPAEILEDERTGLLFPPGDIGSLVSAVVRLATDPALRDRLGRAAAREVRAKWLWERKVQEMLPVYCEVAVNPRERGAVVPRPLTGA